MNKEEILKMAQTENRGRDVADLDAQRKGAYFESFTESASAAMWQCL